MRDLASKVVRAIENSGLTQVALIRAAGLDMSQPTLSRKITGVAQFSADEIDAIAKAIGLTIRVEERNR